MESKPFAPVSTDHDRDASEALFECIINHHKVNITRQLSLLLAHAWAGRFPLPQLRDRDARASFDNNTCKFMYYVCS